MRVFRSKRLVLLAIVFESGLGLVALGLGWCLGVPVWERLGWNSREALGGLAVSIPMLLVFGACLRWPIGPLARIKQVAEEMIQAMFGSASIADLALVSLAAGIGEEMLFRGLVQQGLTDHLSFWPALALASILFGLMHPITPTYVLLAGLMGAYMGWIYHGTKSLLVVIVAHAFYDFVALAYVCRHGPPAKSEPHIS
jgi:membrane protease YdiL (CAAX protease family)